MVLRMSHRMQDFGIPCARRSISGGCRSCAAYQRRAGWPRVLPPRGSHRSGRARIRASGSSTNSFAIQVDPEAIQPSDVDMRVNLDVFDMFPSIESVGRRFAFLHWVLQGEFPSFNSTIKALRHPTAISPHFVSFAWRYLGCTRCFRSQADE